MSIIGGTAHCPTTQNRRVAFVRVLVCHWSPSAAANGIVTHPSDMPVAAQRNAVLKSSVVVLIRQFE
jgi:hypothetical protein